MTDQGLEKVEIRDEDRLLRRVLDLPPHFMIKDDGTPSSSNFALKSDEDGLSVDIERLTTHQKAIQDPSKFRLYYLMPPDTEGLGLVNEHDPLPDNYAHALIKGNITRSVSRKLAKMAKQVSERT